MMLLEEIDAAIANLQALRARFTAPAVPAVVYIDQTDVKALARYKISPRAFLEHARADAFPTEKIGRSVRVRVEDFEAWLASRRRASTARLVVHNDVAAIDVALEMAARRFGRGARR
jgi:hypothetical protein